MSDPKKLLTTEDYQTIMKKWLNKKSVIILQHSIRPLSDKKEGFLGDHYIIEISTGDNEGIKSHRFFLKTKPMKAELSATLVSNLHCFEREATFFNFYITEFEKTLPGFNSDFVAKFMLEKNEELIVFEDLSVKGYRMADNKRFNLDMDHVKLAIEAASKLHASSLAYEEIKTKKSGVEYRFFSEDTGIFKEDQFTEDESSGGYVWLKSGLLGLASLLKYLPNTKLNRKILLDFVEKCCKLMKETKFRRVLIHNDMWQNNMLFKYKNGVPVKVKLIDFQILAYLRPINDLLFFVLLNASKDIQDNYFGYLLRFYHECLSAELKKYDLDSQKILPYSEIQESFKCFYPAFKLKCLLYMSVLMASDEYMAEISKDGKIFDGFMMSDRSPHYIKLCETEKAYKDTILNGLRELEDVILHDTRPAL